MPPERTQKRRGSASEEPRPLSSTCLSCRARKVRCSSGKPICSNCQNNGSECIYKERQKPGLKQGVGSKLMERVAALEATLTRESSRIDGLCAHLPSPSPLMPPPGSTSAVGNGTFHFAPQPPLSYLAQSNGVADGSPMSTGSFMDSTDLPPHDLVLSLIDLFFLHVSPFAPFLLREHVPRDGAPYPITVYAVVVISLRFSVDPRWQLATFPSKAFYHQAARQRVVMNSIDSTSVTSLQALALIALDTVGGGAAPNSWGSLALISRAITHVGLHTEADPARSATGQGQINRVSLLAPPADFREEESRRRLFWSSFILDRWTAVSTGWEFALSDTNFARNLPCSLEAWSENIPTKTPLFRSPIFDDGVPTGFSDTDTRLASLIEIMDLLGRVHGLHRQPLNTSSEPDVEVFLERTRTLDASVRRWFSRLPSEMHEPLRPDSHALVILVLGIYHAALIKLHAIIAHPPNPSTFLQPNADASHAVFLSATQLAAIAGTTNVSDEVPSHSPYLLWCFWVAARVLFVRAYHSSAPIDPSVAQLLEALDAGGKFWDLGRRYSKLLKRALAKLSGSGFGSMAAPDALTQETAVSVLLDFRKTSYAAEGTVPASGTATPAIQDHLVGTPFPHQGFDGLDGMLAGWNPAQGYGGGEVDDPALATMLELHSWFELPGTI